MFFLFLLIRYSSSRSMFGGFFCSCKRNQHILRKKRSPTSLNELTRKGNPQSKWVSERGLVIHPYRRLADNSNKLWTTLLLKRALVCAKSASRSHSYSARYS